MVLFMIWVIFTLLISAAKPELLSQDWELQTIVPPCPIISAPFDVAVLPDGRLITSGSDGRLVVIHENGYVENTRTQCPGSNFEASDDGRIWFYDFPMGTLSVVQPGEEQAQVIGNLPPSYSDSSIAVSPNGAEVYIVWMQHDTRRSVLYRYTENGMERLLEMTGGSVLRAVEVTRDGIVYVASGDGIFVLGDDNRLTSYLKIRHFWISSDSMTSDPDGNFYFAAQGDEKNRGIYRVLPGGKLNMFAQLEDQEVPLGMAWDSKKHILFAAQKETQGIIKISENRIDRIIETSGLTTPIAIAFSPDGQLYINGDESGVMKVTGDGKVKRFRGGIPSYQPPAADMVFDKSGLLYYTCACPGFQSMIITIDADGKVQELTRDTGCPAGIDIDGKGRIFYADYERCAVYRLEPDGKSTLVMGNIPYPVGLVIEPEGTFWVSAASPKASGNSRAVEEIPRTRILRFVLNSGEVEEILNLGTEGWHNLTFFEVGPDGTLYLPDGGSLLIRHPDGKTETMACGFSNIRDAKLAPDGSLYVTDYGASALYRFIPRISIR